jgi:hypothetical protein
VTAVSTTSACRCGGTSPSAPNTLLAIEKARRGIYNIAEPNGHLSTDKARRELGFDPSFRLTAWVT